jgi:succinyl-diaminopimelate desuccinylase
MKELLKKLIQADSTLQKGELAAAEVILDEFRSRGVESRIDSWQQNRANIIAHVKSAKNRPALLFACHLDVVGPGEAAWEHPAFKATESDGRIYGRGAVDMKGGIAAIVTAISRIVEAGTDLQGDIVFLAVAGEETDSSGARRFINDHDWLGGLSGVIIPEPTNFAAVTAHRGMLWLEIITKGVTAHSSTPHLGINAINSMRSVLNELENYEVTAETHPLLGRCSMSINTISGGKALNVVPDKCSIGIDIRTLPGQNAKDIISDLKKMLAELKTRDEKFDAEVSFLRTVEPLETDSGCDFVKQFCAAVGTGETESINFTTDGPFFETLGVPVVIFGPGKPELCHKPDEYIDIADLEKAVERYKNIIYGFLT